MTQKTVIVFMTASLLSACGGGGGSDTPRQIITMGQQSVSLGENTSASLPFTTSASDIAFQITSEQPKKVAVVTVKENVLEIAATETDRPSSLTGILYSEARGIDDGSSKKISVVVGNTSAAKLEARATKLLDQKEDLLALAEDRAIFRFVVDIAYLNSLISHSEKLAFMDDFSASSQPTHGALGVQVNSFATALNDYGSGEISDADLQAKLEFVDDAIASHGQFAATMFSDVAHLSSAFIGDLSVTTLAYDPVSGRYSRFLGHAETGAYSDSNWSFKPDYTLVDSWVSKNVASTLSVCGASL